MEHHSATLRISLPQLLKADSRLLTLQFEFVQEQRITEFENHQFKNDNRPRDWKHVLSKTEALILGTSKVECLVPQRHSEFASFKVALTFKRSEIEWAKEDDRERARSEEDEWTDEKLGK